MMSKFVDDAMRNTLYVTSALVAWFIFTGMGVGGFTVPLALLIIGWHYRDTFHEEHVTFEAALEASGMLHR